MVLSDIHKQIFQNWFKTYTLIYNEALKYIRTNYTFTKKEIIKSILNDEIIKSQNFYNKRYIRNQLKQLKKDIQKRTTFKIDKQYTKTKKEINCSIDIHTLDKAIFQLVQNINASVTNLLRGNINRFRLKFWKYNRPSKTIEMEKTKISNGILCKTIFGNLKDEIKYYYDGNKFDINQIDCDFKINYNSINNEYYLLVSKKINLPVMDNPQQKIVSIDPGLRTFMTCLSENEHIKIGPDVHNIIKNKVTKLNKIINNPNIPIKIKNKNQKLINKKIYNKIEELHWKTINYLVKNYQTIFLGDMSAKSIVRKNNSILSNNSKVACLRTRYYEFMLRLKYKCSIYNRKFKLVNEYYTSKTCSVCGNYNEKLAGELEYNCINCKCIIDRDINGCRNIYMKHLMIEN